MEKAIACLLCYVHCDVTDNPVVYDNAGETQITMLSPVIGFLGVVAAFLGLVLFIGFVTDTGKSQKALHCTAIVVVVVVRLYAWSTKLSAWWEGLPSSNP